MKAQSFLQAVLAISVLLLGGCGIPGESGRATTNGTTSIQGDAPAGEVKSGPTEAPDLVSVGAFREDPTSAQGGPTTLVDFEFDQRIYLKGGDRTSFHLVRVDGGDALDAADVIPEGDREGNRSVVVAFPGDLNPKNFPRAYVDSKVVT